MEATGSLRKLLSTRKWQGNSLAEAVAGAIDPTEVKENEPGVVGEGRCNWKIGLGKRSPDGADRDLSRGR